MIVLDDPNRAVWGKVKEGWPNRNLLLTDRLAFIAPEKITLTREVADHLGFNNSEKIRGLVVQFDHRAGFHESRFIEWLENVA